MRITCVYLRAPLGANLSPILMRFFFVGRPVHCSMSMSDFQRSYLTSSYHNFEPYGVRTKKSLQKRNQIATYRHALPETLSFDVFFPSLIPTAPISTKFYLRRAVEIKLKRGGGVRRAGGREKDAKGKSDPCRA